MVAPLGLPTLPESVLGIEPSHFQPLLNSIWDQAPTCGMYRPVPLFGALACFDGAQQHLTVLTVRVRPIPRSLLPRGNRQSLVMRAIALSQSVCGHCNRVAVRSYCAAAALDEEAEARCRGRTCRVTRKQRSAPLSRAIAAPAQRGQPARLRAVPKLQVSQRVGDNKAGRGRGLLVRAAPSRASR